MSDQAYWVREDELEVKFAQLQVLDESIWEEILTVLKSGRFVGGPMVNEFEREWASYCGARFCASVASGSAALTGALKFVRGTGRVLVPALSFAATVFSVLEADLEPVYVDVDERGLLDVDMANDALSKLDIRAVLPVHMYGQVLDISQLNCDPSMVIEDAAQAHGVHKLMGLAACYSFYPSKNLGAAGDAGAVVTSHANLHTYVKSWSNYGDSPGRKYSHVFQGTNARMDAIQAAILIRKLPGLTLSNGIRAGLAKHMAFDLDIRSFASHGNNAWHLYPILVDQPVPFIEQLSVHGIESGRHYPYTLPSVVDGTVFGSLRNAEFLASHTVSLPIGPHLHTGHLRRVSEVVREVAVPTRLSDGRQFWRVKDASQGTSFDSG